MENFKRALLALSVGLGFGFANIVRADPIVEQIDRLELDWGNLKLRFFGTYKPESSQGDVGYAEIEKHAIGNGLRYAQESLAEIHKNELKKQGITGELAEHSAASAGEFVAHNTYSYQTSLYNDGSVRVYLESNLAKALTRKDAVFLKTVEVKRKDPRFSGLILRLDKPIKPTARYQVVDQSGSSLFGMESVTRDFYEKNLMGRWFTEEPQRDEKIKYVGVKPVSIQVKVVGDDRFMVQKGAWTDALQDSGVLLSEARIILVMPNSTSAPAKLLVR